VGGGDDRPAASVWYWAVIINKVILLRKQNWNLD